MPDRELVNTYLQGQIGRRAFIRRLVASGVSVAAAMSYASILGADPAEAETSATDLYEEDRLIQVTASAITPTGAAVLRGGLVQWNFAPPASGDVARKYTITDPFGFINFAPNDQDLNSGYRAIRFYAAGSFPYSVRVDTKSGPGFGYVHLTTLPAKIQSQMRLSRARVRKGGKVTVSWASRVAPAGHVYDVQIRRPGSTFKTWKSGVAQPRVDFRPGLKGTYRFRARLRRLSDGKRSSYSPARLLRSV
jgi:hypothetical protein